MCFLRTYDSAYAWGNHMLPSHADMSVVDLPLDLPPCCPYTQAMLITFILLGKTLETTAKNRTHHAMSSLLQLAPASALLYSSGTETKATTNDQRQQWARLDGADVREIDGRLVQCDDMLKVLPDDCLYTFQLQLVINWLTDYMLA